MERDRYPFDTYLPGLFFIFKEAGARLSDREWMDELKIEIIELS